MATKTKDKGKAKKGKDKNKKSAFKSRLGKLKGKWKKAKERAKEEGIGGELPDGRYVARLMKAELDESRSSNRLQAHYQYEVTEGEEAGQKINKWDGLESEENLVWFARELARYGYDIDELGLEEAEAVLKELQERAPLVRLRLRTKGEFQNVYLDRVIEDGDEESEDDDPDEADDDEDDDDDEEDDGLDDLSRAQLKKHIKTEELEVKVTKKMTEDEIREAIREASEDEDEDEDDDDDEVEIDVGDVVEFEHAKKTRTSKILKIDEEKGRVQVQVGKKKHWKDAEDITAVSDETDE